MSNRFQSSFIDEPETPTPARPRRSDGRFVQTLPKCPKCGQPYNPKKEKPINVKFNGSDYDPVLDDIQLSGQLLRVFEAMEDGRWWTLRDLSDSVGEPPASVSAQLRHLRKPRFGSHTVEKESLGGGLFKYRLIPNPVTTPKLKRELKK